MAKFAYKTNTFKLNNLLVLKNLYSYDLNHFKRDMENYSSVFPLMVIFLIWNLLV